MPRARQSSADAKPKRSATVPHVDASMNVMEIIALHPGAAGVLSEYGLHCFHCAFNTLDSLEEGAKAHGLTDDDVANIVDDLREVLKTSPDRLPVLTLSESAANALLEIAKNEGKQTCLLKVISDERGGFCMEFTEEVGNDLTFGHPGVDGVSLVASLETLSRIGGSTVDFREGRFKLDLVPRQCACDGGVCNCRT